MVEKATEPWEGGRDNAPSSTLADGASGLRDERHVAGVTVPIWEGLAAKMTEVRQRMTFAGRDVAEDSGFLPSDRNDKILSKLGGLELRGGGCSRRGLLGGGCCPEGSRCGCLSNRARHGLRARG